MICSLRERKKGERWKEYAECRLYEIYEQLHDGSTPDIHNKMDGSLSFFELFMCFLSTFSGSVYTQQLNWRASNNRNSSGGMNYRNNLHDVSGSCWLYGGQLSMVIKFIANRLSAKNACSKACMMSTALQYLSALSFSPSIDAHTGQIKHSHMK